MSVWKKLFAKKSPPNDMPTSMPEIGVRLTELDKEIRGLPKVDAPREREYQEICLGLSEMFLTYRPDFANLDKSQPNQENAMLDTLRSRRPQDDPRITRLVAMSKLALHRHTLARDFVALKAKLERLALAGKFTQALPLLERLANMAPDTQGGLALRERLKRWKEEGHL
jgi:hypothetical protein